MTPFAAFLCSGIRLEFHCLVYSPSHTPLPMLPVPSGGGANKGATFWMAAFIGASAGFSMSFAHRASESTCPDELTTARGGDALRPLYTGKTSFASDLPPDNPPSLYSLHELFTSCPSPRPACLTVELQKMKQKASA